MAKLYFRYGAMRSAKTLNLLAVAHNYKAQGKNIAIIKPAIDNRYGIGIVESRAGLKEEADIVVRNNDERPMDTLLRAHFDSSDLSNASCILVDEAQFVSPHVIDQLRQISLTYDVPVICYGLRTDFRARLFPGAARLMELADSIEEIKVTCQFCNKKATMNMRILNGKPTLNGEQIQIGGDESYIPVCYRCYHAELGHPGL